MNFILSKCGQGRVVKMPKKLWMSLMDGPQCKLCSMVKEPVAFWDHVSKIHGVMEEDFRDAH